MGQSKLGQAEVILLDTHVVLWLTTSSRNLSPAARSSIAEARRNSEALAISDITLLELAVLATKSRITLQISIADLLQQLESRFAVLPITAKASAATLSLPASYPNDPADRIIGGTALVEGLALITADREIRRSNAFRTIW